MKVVLDTNVVISGIYFGGIPEKVFQHIFEYEYQVILSEDIIFEYFDVNQRIAKKKSSPIIDPIATLDLLISKAMIIDSTDVKTPACEDPDDIKFLQAAIAGKANCLISGDKHLLDVKRYKGGVMLKPKDFISVSEDLELLQVAEKRLKDRKKAIRFSTEDL